MVMDRMDPVVIVGVRVCVCVCVCDSNGSAGWTESLDVSVSEWMLRI